VSGPGGAIPYRDIEEMPEGVQFEFRFDHRFHRWTRFRSDGRANTFGRPAVALAGAFGRAWLADACTTALEDSLYARRLWESEADKADRIARRKEKDKTAAEAATARAKPARRRDW
jgi:hypothetical protein